MEEKKSTKELANSVQKEKLFKTIFRELISLDYPDVTKEEIIETMEYLTKMYKDQY